MQSSIVSFVIPTGSPSESDICSILDNLLAQGITQFMLYPSNGLDYSYMGEEFLAMTEKFAVETAARGMKMWLYDDYNWPSGTAHGRVPAENPDFRYKELVGYADKDGNIEWTVLTSQEINEDSGSLDGNNFEPEGVKRFMELTHYVYEKRLKRFFGNTIAGIFTDEPGWASGSIRMAVPEGTRVRFPYWRGLEEDYAAMTQGGDFRKDAAAAIQGGHPEDSFVFQAFIKLRCARYRACYFTPISDWCRRMGLLSTGHVLGEDNAGLCARYNGTPLITLRGLLQPGIDMIRSMTDYDFEWLTLATAQHVADRNGCLAMAELFALGPCDLSFTDLRRMFWVSAMHKIGIFFTTMYHTTARRFLKKPAWAMFWSPTQPWYPYSKTLVEAADEAAAYAARRFICRIAVRYPAGRLGAAYLANAPALPLAQVCRLLTWNQFTFDLYEEDERCDQDVILGWDEHGLLDERSGTRFDNPEAAVGWLEECFGHRRRLLDAAGRTRQGILTREYENGDIISIDLMTGELFRNGCGEYIPVEGRAIAAEWQLRLDGPSRRRMWFRDNGQAEIILTAPLDEVRFAVRNYPAGEFRVLLDGQPLEFSKQSECLVYAYNEIYRETEPMRLEAGQHTWTLLGGTDDMLFLPALWMVGQFCEQAYGVLEQCPVAVTEGSLESHGLGSFAGTAEYSTDACFDAGEALMIDSAEAVVAVTLGGCPLGTRCWAPFRWEIPAELVGKTLPLKIAVTTSVRPCFGAEDAPDASVKHSLWTKSSTGLRPGLLKAVKTRG